MPGQGPAAAGQEVPQRAERPDAGRPALFETLVELARDQVSVVDAAGRTVYANAAARAAYGSDPEAEGVSYVHPDDVDPVRAANERLVAVPGGSETIRCRLRHQDGTYAHVESVGVNLLHVPEVRGLLYLTRDVTQRVRAERELDRQLAGQRLVADLGLRSLRGAGVADLARDALRGLRRVLDVDHVHLLDVEDGGLRVRDAVGDRPVLAGTFFPAACVAQSPAGLSLSQREPVVVADLAAEPEVVLPPRLVELGVVSSLVALLDTACAPTGAIAAHSSTPRRFSEADVALTQAVANVLAGAAAAARREAEAEHRAMHDPLTGLANRALLEDRLTKALQRAARDGSSVTLLFVDLDGFKGVNDTHGHAAGDGVLSVLAGRLQAHFRSADTVARLGGDEFVVLCGDAGDPDDSGCLRRRVEDVWAEPVPLPPAVPGAEPVLVRVTGTLGVATARAGECDAAQLLARADAAMYRTKRARAD